MTQDTRSEREDGRGLGRRDLFKGIAAVGLGSISARGIYEALGDVVRPTAAQAATTTTVRRFQEQYLIRQLEVILDNGQTVVIPPIFNDVITAKLKPSTYATVAALKAAKTRLENALVRVESPYPDTAAGLTIVVGWGMPYFRNNMLGGGVLDPTFSNGYLPRVPNGGSFEGDVFAVREAVKFDSDPADLVIENNHVMFKFRSDLQSTLAKVEGQLFDPNVGDPAYIGDLFDVTSKRMGFAGRGFSQLSYAKTLLQDPKKGNPGLAALIPDRSQLMMGFTSTQTQALGPDNIVSFETLRGVTDQWPAKYFAAGTAMHLSHLYLKLDQWYASTNSYDARVRQMFSPRTTATAGTVTVPNGPDQVANITDVRADAAQGLSGHNSLLQQATRLASDVVDNYGRLRRKGTAIPVREDFNTLDDPFAMSSSGAVSTDYAPGLHFVAFVPSHVAFLKARRAMDGRLPDGSVLDLKGNPAGINAIMHATHRQNYVIPPRSNRSFPLVEFLK